MHTFEITVKGMTCQHCSAAVSQALKEIAGVNAVSVDLPGGKVSITADTNSSDLPDKFRQAVEEAGYQTV